MWQCAVCGSSNGDDVAACASCGARRPEQGPSNPAAQGLGSWPPPGTLPADPPVAWPASAPADAFGSWSPSGGTPAPGSPGGQEQSPGAFPALPAASQAPAPNPAPQQWPASGPPANDPAAQQWPGAGQAPPPWAPNAQAQPSSGVPDAAAQHWPGAGAGPGQALPPWAPNAEAPPASGAGQFPPWAANAQAQPTSGVPSPGAPGGDLAAQHWPGAGPGLGQAPPPWAANAQTQQTSGAGQAPPWAGAPQQPWAGGGQVVEEHPGRRPVWIFPAIVALVLLLAGGTVAFVLRDRWLPAGNNAANPTAEPTGTSNPVGPTTGAVPTNTGPPQPTPTTTTAGPPTLPASVGTVRLDPSLDPAQGPAVAAVFDKYFAAVNARNAPAALAVMDPNGSINQGDSGAVKRFSDGISTSSDDDVLLLALGSDPTGKGVLQARVTFRSQQQAGKGPKGRESETCTRWDVTYSITQPGGEYRIWGSTNAGNRPC